MPVCFWNQALRCRPELSGEVIFGFDQTALLRKDRRRERSGLAWLSCARQPILQARPRATVVSRHARNRTTNTRVANFVEMKPADGSATTVRTAVKIAIRAKTIVHPSIYRFLRSGTGCPA